MKVISPFGPKIAKLKISKSIVNKINNEVEKIINKKKLSKKHDYSKKLVGQVQQEIELSKKIKIKNLWVVRQFANEYNPVHYHDGHISGVGYLKIPKNIFKDKKNINTNGTIDFINGNKMFLNESIHNHKPKIGDVILFPHYLMHTAYPFTVEGERRSFSFNIEIDNHIANIFKK